MCKACWPWPGRKPREDTPKSNGSGPITDSIAESMRGCFQARSNTASEISPPTINVPACSCGVVSISCSSFDLITLTCLSWIKPGSAMNPSRSSDSHSFTDRAFFDFILWTPIAHVHRAAANDVDFRGRAARGSGATDCHPLHFQSVPVTAKSHHSSRWPISTVSSRTCSPTNQSHHGSRDE